MSKVKNLVLGFGIFIVYMLVLAQGIETFYPSPDYQDFCSFPSDLEARAQPIPIVEPDLDCKKGFDDARDIWSRNVFVIALIVGVITLIVGYSVLSSEPVGSALIASGIGAIFYASVTNWRNFTDVWRFLLLVLAFVFLVWLALRLNKKKKFWQFWK